MVHNELEYKYRILVVLFLGAFNVKVSIQSLWLASKHTHTSPEITKRKVQKVGEICFEWMAWFSAFDKGNAFIKFSIVPPKALCANN